VAVPAVSALAAKGVDELRRVDETLLSDQVATEGEQRQGCEWEEYYCNVAYYWTIPDAYGDDYFNMRFTPPDCCTLVTVGLCFYKDYPEFSDASGSGVDIIVWDDNGSGLPGTEILRLNVPSASMAYYPNWVYLDVTAYNLVFCPNEEIHVGFTTVD
jgi:hypothetical protein